MAPEIMLIVPASLDHSMMMMTRFRFLRLIFRCVYRRKVYIELNVVLMKHA